MIALLITTDCWHLDWQVSSAAKISNSLRPLLYAIKHLTLEYKEHSQSSEEHYDSMRLTALNFLARLGT